MSAVDARTREVQAWSLQEAAAAQRVASNATGATAPLWATFAGWYAATRTAQLARQTATVAEAARETAGDIGLAYMIEVLAALGVNGVPNRRLKLPPARQGADMTAVYARAAASYRLAFALSGSTEEALRAAADRLGRLIEDDVMLGRRDGEHEGMLRGGVQRYRRIIHPELAAGGSCGLCVAASDRIYKSKVLRPIHGRCGCTSAPIVGSYDPGEANKVDLAAVYEAAGGSNKGDDLKRARFKVDEHGELGPVLTQMGEHFQGPGDPDQADPIERARRRLVLAEPVLEQLLGDREDLAALRYQENFVAHLRATVGAAA